jgi:hypothetical protein
MMRALLLGTAAAVIFVTTTYGQISDSIRGPASEVNHFIETPKGWVHPKTPWGEPDIQANLNMMQAAGVPLERCANAIGRGNCDMNKAWWTEEEYKADINAAPAAATSDVSSSRKASSAVHCSPASPTRASRNGRPR